MRRLGLACVTIIALLGSTGCLGKQFKRDGIIAHEAISDLHTEQALSNLIRAHCNMPFVQLKYSQILVQDEDTYTGNAGIDQTITTVRDLFALGASRTLDNAYSTSGTAQRHRLLSFNADPVTDQNDIYIAYLAFARDANLFVMSEAPPACPVHTMRRYGKKYFWVPADAGSQFLDLVLKTSLMRGPEAIQPTAAAYEVRIADVLDHNQVEGRDIANAKVAFDKAVPNGQATLIFDLENGRRIRVGLMPVDTDVDGKRVHLGKPTPMLRIQWAPVKDGFSQHNLPGRPARVYSHDYPPGASTPDPVIRGISANLNQIRANVLSPTRER